MSSPPQPRKLTSEEIEARRLAKLKKLAESAPTNFTTTTVNPASDVPIADRQMRRRVKGEDNENGGTIVVGEDAKGRGWYEYVEFGTRRFRTRKISDEEIFTDSLIAGAAVDLIKVAALHPIDTARARAQWNAKGRPGAAPPSGSVWAGLGPAIATSAPCIGLYYASTEVLGRYVRAAVPNPTFAALLVMAAGEAADKVARAPLDAIKLEQQTRPANTTAQIGAGQAAVVGFSTYPLSLATELPYVLLRLALFKQWKAGAGSSSFAVDLGVYVGLSVLIAALTTPLDVIRTRTLKRYFEDTIAMRTKGTAATHSTVAANSTAAATDSTGAVDTTAAAMHTAAADGTAAANTTVAVDSTAVLDSNSSTTAPTTGGEAPLLMPLADWPTPVDATREVVLEGGVAGLFAGAGARMLWNGCAVGTTLPLRRLGFTLLRDSLVLGLGDTTLIR